MIFNNAIDNLKWQLVHEDFLIKKLNDVKSRELSVTYKEFKSYTFFLKFDLGPLLYEELNKEYKKLMNNTKQEIKNLTRFKGRFVFLSRMI
jgi:hypothetical protein